MFPCVGPKIGGMQFAFVQSRIERSSLIVGRRQSPWAANEQSWPGSTVVPSGLDPTHGPAFSPARNVVKAVPLGG